MPKRKVKVAAKKKTTAKRSARVSLGKSKKKAPKVSVANIPTGRARYDAALTGPENRDHWRGADALSPNAAANSWDRKVLRERARYEVANNSFAFGAANAIAEDMIGTGPRNHLIGIADEMARQVEDQWQAWCDEIGLGNSLRLKVRSGVVDGEGFALATDNPKLRHPVKLDFRVFECDRVTDPQAAFNPFALVDGIEFDSFGNPTTYTILRDHPGDGTTFGFGEFDVFPADQVYHWFRADRPGQARGVSWLTPALPLFSVLRRYTMAVLSASETAASIGAVVKSDLPPGSEAVDVEEREEVPIPRGTLYTLPPGWDITQIKPEHPTQQFGDFRTQILSEIGRVLDMPLNRVTGNSSGYNYSSGRLDHLGYHAALWRHRDALRLRVLDRLFRAWLDEATLAGILPAGLPPFAELTWDWQWDSFGDIDPQKEASAAQALLAANLTTLAEQCAARGLRWDQVLRQKAREKDLMDELGLTPAAPAPVVANDPPPEDEEEKDDADKEEEEEPEEEEAVSE